MNPFNLSDLNNDQIAALLAESSENIGMSSSRAWMWRDERGCWHCCYQDDNPALDLNAMRAAERSQNQNPSFWQPYWQNLRHVVEHQRKPYLTADVDVGCAGALERAKAFIITKGLAVL